VSKKVRAVVKLQLNAGKATPAPPVGSTLGGYGIALVNFVKEYNERTAANIGSIIPVEITIYEDRSYSFITKMPPVADLLRKAAKVEHGSGKPNLEKVGRISRKQLREIAETKMKDLNAYDVDAAERIIEGTARSMGIDVTR